MGYNWHWRVLFETEPGGTGSYLHYLIVGLGWVYAYREGILEWK